MIQLVDWLAHFSATGNFNYRVKICRDETLKVCRNRRFSVSANFGSGFVFRYQEDVCNGSTHGFSICHSRLLEVVDTEQSKPNR